MYQSTNGVAAYEAGKDDVLDIVYMDKIEEAHSDGYMIFNADGFRKAIIYNPIAIEYDESVYS